MNTSPELVLAPDPDWVASTRIGRFASAASELTGTDLRDYERLWRWSVEDLDGFWSLVWDQHGVVSSAPRGPALADPPGEVMPGASWFPDARVNYARHLLEDADPEHDLDHEVAVVAHSQTRQEMSLTFCDLRAEVARVRAGLLDLGVRPGDRVAAYLPNIPETIVAFLATASLGAVWCACAPEFGARSVVDRFAQVEPTVLLAITGYKYGDKLVDRRDELAQVRSGLPTVRTLVHVPYGDWDESPPGALSWNEFGDASAVPAYQDVTFDHPLCILFSSGTTGRPKAIVHGHGGILLEHLKNHSLSWDLGPGDRMLWFTTTAWMMWNALVSCLLVRASVVLVDGNPLYPDPDLQWRLAERTGTTVLGLSPGFIMATRRAGSSPGTDYDLSTVRQVCSAGSPLPAEGCQWVAHELPGVLLNVGSGGTDLCSGIVQGSPAQPVWAGEISGPCLGVHAQAFDEHGRPVVGELGELVITAPMPSMPVGFWGDIDGSRYRDAYFDRYPGVWRHGDWVRFSDNGSAIIAGRSDATLNRGGVRLGTAEFYRVVEELDDIAESLVVHLEDPEGGPGELILYVVTVNERPLTDELIAGIRTTLRTALSPRHIPDAVVAAPSVPHTRTGKKLELPVKGLLLGRTRDEVAAPGSLADDTALDFYVEQAFVRRGAS